MYIQIEVIRQISHGQINPAAVSVALFDYLYCKRESLTATDEVTRSCCETGEIHARF